MIDAFFVVADSGTKRMLLGAKTASAPEMRVAYEGPASFEPRHAVVRSDATVVVSLSGSSSGRSAGQSSPADDSAAVRHGGAGTAWAALIAALLGTFMLQTWNTERHLASHRP
jgi:hypothetical protein